MGRGDVAAFPARSVCRRRADPRHRRFAGPVCPAPAPAAAVRPLGGGAFAPAVARLSPVAVEPVPSRGERGRGGALRRRRLAHRRAAGRRSRRTARLSGCRARLRRPRCAAGHGHAANGPGPAGRRRDKRRTPRAARLAHRPRLGGSAAAHPPYCPLRARPAPLPRLRALRGRFCPPVARPSSPAPPAAPAPLRRHRRAATYGLLRPVILLPAGFDLSDREALDCVLRHELAHVRRFDALFKAALAVTALPALVQPARLGDAGARQPRSRACLRRAGPARRRPRAPPRLRPRPFAAGGDARASPAAGQRLWQERRGGAHRRHRQAPPRLPRGAGAHAAARRPDAGRLHRARRPGESALRARGHPDAGSGQRRSPRFRHARAPDPRTARRPREHLPCAPARGSLRRLRALRPQIRRRRPPPRLVGRALLHGHGPLRRLRPRHLSAKLPRQHRTSSPFATNTAR